MNIVATNITKVFGMGHTAVRAVDGVSLTIREGEIILIMGPSGSGKTTLLTILGGLLSPTSGSVRVGNTDITFLKENVLPEFRLKNIGFIFQTFNLLSALNAAENAAVPLIARGTSRKKSLGEAGELLTRLGLENRLFNMPSDLSGGEKQRVAIARALITDPGIIFADEPTANLDSKNGHEVVIRLCAIACENHKTVVIVSHDQRIKDIAHRILWLEDGKITGEEQGRHKDVCPHEKDIT